MSIYRVVCLTEDTFVLTSELSSLPTECPNNAGHTIDASRTVLVSSIASSKPIIYATSFVEPPSLPYKTADSGTFVICCQFKYPGSNIQGLSQLSLMLSIDGDETGCFQLIDTTNGKIVVAATNWSAGSVDDPITANVTTFTNVPINEAILELVIKKVSGTNNVNIHGMTLK